MNLITISNVSIRQFDNLYNLNDFHRASGGENRHRPSFWLQNQQALDLINELNLENASVGNPTVPVIKVINGGRNRGTYVCKELIYAYATWVSAKFFLQVIRTFDSVVSGSLKLEPPKPALPYGAVVLDHNDLHNLRALLKCLAYQEAYYQKTKKAVYYLNPTIIYRSHDWFNDATLFAGALADRCKIKLPQFQEVIHYLES